ncbi:MAG: thioredoxin [bacterium]|nr:thioredoxin [bacterium]
MSIHITEAQFDAEVLKSPIPVFVDFYAEWCGPCKAIAPIVEELAKEYEGRVKVVEINVDEEGELGMRYSVMSIPTLFFFKGGNPIDQHVGAISKTDLKKKFDALLA